MNHYLRVGVILIACSVLVSCGFHLRRHAATLKAKYPVIVLPFSGSHTLHQALRRTLLARAVVLVKDTSEADGAPILRVVSQEQTEQPIVYGPDSELRRTRLFMTITFSFGCAAPKQFVLSTIRDHQLYSTQHLGDNAEKSLTETEMQADIIDQLLRYIESEPFS